MKILSAVNCSLSARGPPGINGSFGEGFLRKPGFPIAHPIWEGFLRETGFPIRIIPLRRALSRTRRSPSSEAPRCGPEYRDDATTVGGSKNQERWRGDEQDGRMIPTTDMGRRPIGNNAKVQGQNYVHRWSLAPLLDPEIDEDTTEIHLLFAEEQSTQVGEHSLEQIWEIFAVSA
ncbi:hypothetical protein FB451DRAFT_1191340 [Mycena latifolia]|nr:hypothetical protein FB451DRAFT_1191340 [Mycena latifolia]